MRTMFRATGWLTLLVDAYLLLALPAIARMKVEYHHLLPPFGWEPARSVPATAYFCLIGWTGFLALGLLCTTPRRDPPAD